MEHGVEWLLNTDNLLSKIERSAFIIMAVDPGKSCVVIVVIKHHFLISVISLQFFSPALSAILSNHFIRFLSFYGHRYPPTLFMLNFERGRASLKLLLSYSAFLSPTIVVVWIWSRYFWQGSTYNPCVFWIALNHSRILILLPHCILRRSGISSDVWNVNGTGVDRLKRTAEGEDGSVQHLHTLKKRVTRQ